VHGVGCQLVGGTHCVWSELIDSRHHYLLVRHLLILGRRLHSVTVPSVCNNAAMYSLLRGIIVHVIKSRLQSNDVSLSVQSLTADCTDMSAVSSSCLVDLKMVWNEF